MNKKKDNKKKKNYNKKGIDTAEGVVWGLVRESMDIYMRSELLREAAEFDLGLIEEWNREYSGVGNEYGMGGGDIIRIESGRNLLLRRIGIVEVELRKLDKDYEDIMRRVNQHYGKEVIKKMTPLEKLNIDLDIGGGGNI